MSTSNLIALLTLLILGASVKTLTIAKPTAEATTAEATTAEATTAEATTADLAVEKLEFVVNNRKQIAAATQLGQIFKTFFDKLRELLMQAVSRLSASNSEDSRKIISAVRQQRNCPSQPGLWIKFRGMCLRLLNYANSGNYPYSYYYWDSAKTKCRSNGGYLAWIEDKEEHEVINAFLAEDNFFNHYNDKIVDRYYIGLYRPDASANLTWLGGSQSKYHGNPFHSYPNETYFYSRAGSTEIGGIPKRFNYTFSNFPFVCRY